MTRQKILITGASSGLGAEMARQFAAKGRDLALCARRTEALEELKAELLGANPGIKVAVRALDVTNHESVPVVFGELRDELGGLDRVVVNAGIAKGWHLGGGKSWANIQTIETNLIGALVQIEAALACSGTGLRAPGPHLIGDGGQGAAWHQSRLCGQQGRTFLAG